MELRQLRYFVTVVEEGTISAAAKKLFLSQPPLSAQMRLLEGELGCVLFRRGQRQIQLTEAGRRLYEKAVLLLELGRVTREEMRAFATDQAGTIRLGIVSSVVSPMAARWIGEFSARYPDMRFEVYESNTYELIEKLRADILQLALVRSPYTGDGLTALPLGLESLCAVGLERFFSDAGPGVSLRALSVLPLIFYRRWAGLFEEKFERAGLACRPRCVCDDARTVLELAEMGVGVGLVPPSVTALISGREMVCKTLEDCEIQSRIDLIYREGICLPAGAGAFLTFLSERAEIPRAGEGKDGKKLQNPSKEVNEKKI